MGISLTKRYTPAERLVRDIVRDNPPPMTPAKERELEENWRRIAAGDLTLAEARCLARQERENEFVKSLKIHSAADGQDMCTTTEE